VLPWRSRESEEVRLKGFWIVTNWAYNFRLSIINEDKNGTE
jgi:hypothetical protein